VVLVEDLISETLRLKKLLQYSYGVFFSSGRGSSLRFLDKAVIFSIFHLETLHLTLIEGVSTLYDVKAGMRYADVDIFLDVH
jgi:hypothetical protein